MYSKSASWLIKHNEHNVWIRCTHFTFYKSTKDLIIDGEKKKNVLLLIKNSVLEKNGENLTNRVQCFFKVWKVIALNEPFFHFLLYKYKNCLQELIAWNKPFHFFSLYTYKNCLVIQSNTMNTMLSKMHYAINYFGSLFRLRIFSLYWRRKKRCFRASFYYCALKMR